MKILQIFNKYSHVGGEELAVERITGDLSTKHIVENITFNSRIWMEQAGAYNRISQFIKMVWNKDSINQVSGRINEFQPDLIVLHNIMPVGSAGLYWFLSRCGVPLVHYIHNFRPFSVNGYCWGRGRMLPQGIDKNFFPEIIHGSWQESKIKTAWYAILIWGLHISGVYRKITGWVAISTFMKEVFVKGGIDEEKIEVLPHTWDSDSNSKEESEDNGSVLFLGRLTEEKGVLVLLDAWELVEKRTREGRLVIAGSGPLEEIVRSRCGSLERAEFIGFTSGNTKRDRLQSCRALAVPSIWWEPLGLVLYEAYEFSKPVIAARTGGIVDHVEHNVTGWLHDPGNVTQLAEHINLALEDASKAAALGRAGNMCLKDRNVDDWLSKFDRFAIKLIECNKNNKFVSRSNCPEALDNRQNSEKFNIQIYLADQNPKLGRSLGISRMTLVVLNELKQRDCIRLKGISSSSSVRAPLDVDNFDFPWATKSIVSRVLTDHLHPLFAFFGKSDIWYYPKGFLPGLHMLCSPSVVTIHDTILQYYEDHYPDWRSKVEYLYWANMLKHTLRNANFILTVSKSSKEQIECFIDRHGLPKKEIVITYEPCLYEPVPQPTSPSKGDFVLHLASREPHKRTEWLINHWIADENSGLPPLHLVGVIPDKMERIVEESEKIVSLPFLSDESLQEEFMGARALIFPSEMEGFGLPAIEAYYLGTPVCFVKGTSVEEILKVATQKGGFDLNQPDSLNIALNEVLSISADEIESCGLILRNTYSATKVVDKMTQVFIRALKN